nr:1-aminocyclopropane-1-carboxylate synthase-like [Tanacetum cinerariifolium]
MGKDPARHPTFYGSKKATWIKWSNVLADKAKGGLGVSSLYALNRGLMIKWLWRFYARNTSLWVRIVKAIHGEDGKVGQNISSRSYSCWLNIVKVVSVLQAKGVNVLKYVRLKLGNGESTLFWKDNWINGGVLKDVFPRLYALEMWGAEQAQLDILSDMVREVGLVHMSDRYIWSLEGSRDFSLASIRKKVKMDALPVRFNISRRGIDIGSIVCPVCESGVETASHLFFNCSLLRQIARKVSSWWNVDYFDANSYDEWLDWLGSLRLLAKLKLMLEGVFYAIATNNGHGENSPYFDGWKAYDANPFNLQRNPSGVIQMGLAENQLCFDLIQKWVEENSNASICTPQGSSDFKETAIFQDYHGLPEFRAAIANFMSHVRGNRVEFDPDRIVMSGGATGAHETVAFCLANPGEAFLVPTPYYPGFDRDLRWRTGVELVPVVCESSNNFKITREALETAYDNAILANSKVKGLLITNPSNPLGTFLDKDTLKDLVSFINEKNIHLVCDEIYAATVTSGDEFVSIAEVIKEEPECNLDLIHIVYSLSKDMGFPGFRVGIVYSYNDKVVNIARKMSSFGLVSTQTQHMLASMLSDNKFVENFISESRVRLAHRHEMFTRGLSQVGIGSLESNAGLFIWMDLRRFLKEPTFESETTFWRIIINEIKLNVSPGQSFHCSEPGWFRVCFANMDDETTMIALRRIKKFVLKNNIEIKTKRPMWQSNQHLRLSSRRLDEMLTPHRMSPHSPLASPLVRAQN